MDIHEFISFMKQGREMEFSLNTKLYFLQPDYDLFEGHLNLPLYSFFCLYDAGNYQSPEEIFRGNEEEIMSYKFFEGYTLKDNFEKFKIQFVF